MFVHVIRYTNLHVCDAWMWRKVEFVQLLDASDPRVVSHARDSLHCYDLPCVDATHVYFTAVSTATGKLYLMDIALHVHV